MPHRPKPSDLKRLPIAIEPQGSKIIYVSERKTSDCPHPKGEQLLSTREALRNYAIHPVPKPAAS